MNPDIQSFTDTVQHAVLIHHKIQALTAQMRESLSVAGLIAERENVPTDVMTDTMLMLREEKVAGRGFIGRPSVFSSLTLKAEAKYRDHGVSHVLTKGNPNNLWPAKGVSIVYVLFNESGVVIYVGRSGNMRARIKGHFDKPWHTAQLYVCRDHQHSVDVEAATILHYKPTLNKAGRW